MKPLPLLFMLVLLNRSLWLTAFAFAIPNPSSEICPTTPMQEHQDFNPDKLSSSQSGMDADARAYNNYASAVIELSDGHVSDNGLFTGKLFLCLNYFFTSSAALDLMRPILLCSDAVCS